MKPCGRPVMCRIGGLPYCRPHGRKVFGAAFTEAGDIHPQDGLKCCYTPETKVAEPTVERSSLVIEWPGIWNAWEIFIGAIIDSGFYKQYMTDLELVRSLEKMAFASREGECT